MHMFGEDGHEVRDNVNNPRKVQSVMLKHYHLSPWNQSHACKHKEAAIIEAYWKDAAGGI